MRCEFRRRTLSYREGGGRGGGDVPQSGYVVVGYVVVIFFSSIFLTSAAAAAESRARTLTGCAWTLITPCPVNHFQKGSGFDEESTKLSYVSDSDSGSLSAADRGVHAAPTQRRQRQRPVRASIGSTVTIPPSASTGVPPVPRGVTHQPAAPGPGPVEGGVLSMVHRKTHKNERREVPSSRTYVTVTPYVRFFFERQG